MDQYRHPQTSVTVSASATTEKDIYKEGDGLTSPASPNNGGRYSWVTLDARPDQDMILIHRWGPTALTTDANMKIINGSAGLGITLSSTAAEYETSIKLRPGRNWISIKTTGTPPTVNGYANVVAWELNSFPGKIQ